jgi:hypothetical protein
MSWVFQAVIEVGAMGQQVVLPSEVRAVLPNGTRVVGALDGHGFSRVVVGLGGDVSCVRFGRAWLRTAGLAVGDVVEVDLAVDPHPDLVEVPDELAAAFDADPLAEHLWEGLTPGRQRSLAHSIDRGKRPETRQRRAAAIVAELHAIAD